MNGTPARAASFDCASGLLCALILHVRPAVGDSRQSPVVGIGSFSHAVRDIHTAITFCRDVFGLELLDTRPPLVDGKMGPNVCDFQMQAVMDVGGAYCRWATFRIPAPASTFSWSR